MTGDGKIRPFVKAEFSKFSPVTSVIKVDASAVEKLWILDEDKYALLGWTNKLTDEDRKNFIETVNQCFNSIIWQREERILERIEDILEKHRPKRGETVLWNTGNFINGLLEEVQSVKKEAGR